MGIRFGMASTHCFAHWCARVFAGLLVLVVLAFLIGEGMPPIAGASTKDVLQHVAFFTFVCGLVVGFFHELAGGLITLGGLAAFYAINFAASGRLPHGLFPWFAVPGLLYLVSAGTARSCTVTTPLNHAT
jgi:hypothetical protein